MAAPSPYIVDPFFYFLMVSVSVCVFLCECVCVYLRVCVGILCLFLLCVCVCVRLPAYTNVQLVKPFFSPVNAGFVKTIEEKKKFGFCFGFIAQKMYTHTKEHHEGD